MLAIVVNSVYNTDVPFVATFIWMKGWDSLRSFWKLQGVFTTRRLATQGLLVALIPILSLFTSFLSAEFKLFDISFLPGAVGAYLFGPWAGLFMGIAGDTINYAMAPMPPYFPGYIISAILQNLIYAAFLYQKKVTWIRVFSAQILIVVLIHMGLNLYWLHILYGTSAAVFFTGWRIPKNIILLFVSAILVYFLCRVARTQWDKMEKS